MAGLASSRWGWLFDQACSIIEQANTAVDLVDRWSFGGGTALMLQIDHRESFDIDIFLDDPQLLPFLNPQTQGYGLARRPAGYHTDGSRTLKIVFEEAGEIDFICAPSLTAKPTAATEVRGVNVLLETPAEIIAKKIHYRGASMQPRDMFDIACVVKALGRNYVLDALAPFEDECAKALTVARQMNPAFAQNIMAKLLLREDFSEIPGEAQAITIALLESVCTSSHSLKTDK